MLLLAVFIEVLPTISTGYYPDEYIVQVLLGGIFGVILKFFFLETNKINIDFESCKQATL